LILAEQQQQQLQVQSPQQQQQQQQQLSLLRQSPVGPPAGASAAQVSLARRARHTRNSSSCSDAAFQLEQQLLEVFETPSSFVGSSSSWSGSSRLMAASGVAANQGPSKVEAAGVTEELLVLPFQQQQQCGTLDILSSSTPAAAAAAAVAAEDDGDEDCHYSSQDDSAMHALSAAEHSDSSSSSIDGGGPASSSALEQTQLGQLPAAASVLDEPQQPSAVGSGSSSSPSSALLLLQFIFNLCQLEPCSPSILKPQPEFNDINNEPLNPNQLVLEVSNGVYRLPAGNTMLDTRPSSGLLNRNSSWEELDYDLAAAGADGGLQRQPSLLLLPGFGATGSSSRSGLQTWTAPAQLASLEKQQQLYR
jgi:hypothetical protein